MTMRFGPPGTCRAPTCRAQFQWAETAARRRMPVDLEPAGTGNVRLVPRAGLLPPLAEVLTAGELVAARAAGEPLYLAHFATCPGRRRPLPR